MGKSVYREETGSTALVRENMIWELEFPTQVSLITVQSMMRLALLMPLLLTQSYYPFLGFQRPGSLLIKSSSASILPAYSRGYAV